MFIWGVAGLVTMAKSPHAVVTKRQTQPQPWLIHDWMEEKSPDLPQEIGEETLAVDIPHRRGVGPAQ